VICNNKSIAACLFHKDENDYLDEWLDYHQLNRHKLEHDYATQES
jgi:hemerythrin